MRLNGQVHYLGKSGTDEAKANYDAAISQWLARGRQAPVPQVELRVCELISRFWTWAETYYRDPDGGLGWARGNVNKQIGRIRRILKWGVSEQIVEPSVLHGCQAVAPLKRGRSIAKATKPAEHVELTHVEAVKPLLSRHIAAMVDVQLRQT